MITYSLESDDDDTFALFKIDRNFGTISLLSLLDAEIQNSHLLRVVATDNGSPTKSSFTTILVNVTDVNDNIPAFLLQKYSFFVDGYVKNQFVGKVHAFDRDSNSSLLYSMFKPSIFIEIDSLSGSLYLKSKPVPVSVIKCQVDVTDGENNVNVDVDVIIYTRNENQPMLLGSSIHAEIDENLGNSKKFVTAVNAVDPDKGKYGVVSYQIDSAALSLLFTINKKGHIYTSGEPFDREKASRYILPVRVTDEGGLFSLTDVIVDVKDDNDNPPIFEFPSYEASITTSQMSAESLLHVIAHDADEGINAELAYIAHGLQ